MAEHRTHIGMCACHCGGRDQWVPSSADLVSVGGGERGRCTPSFEFTAMAAAPARKIIKERGRRKGQKGHFTTVLSPSKSEMIILLGEVFRSKFNNNKSVHQQMVLFSVSTSKERSISVSRCKFWL